MAQIYAAVRLLPPDHPYLQTDNKGRFGIRNVIAAAANNLVFSRKNIDQIIIFFALMLGFVLLIVQFGLLIFTFVMAKANAGPFAGLFATPGCGPGALCPDIAFILLDEVFGIPGLYNSSSAPAGPGSIPPFNLALHNLFNYYNLAILVVGVLIFLYYVVVMVVETAQSGTPFGRRFSHIYAPLRLVLAIGLLVPLNYGFNAAQYITLFAAKAGSSFATNGWLTFNTGLGTAALPIGGPKETLLARPKAPDIRHLLAFMTVVHTCKAAYEHEGRDRPLDIEAYLVTNTPASNSQVAFGPGYASALTFHQQGDIVVRFGQLLPAGGGTYMGDVNPYCGEITIKVNVRTATGAITFGAPLIQQRYFELIQELWESTSLRALGQYTHALYASAPGTTGTPGPNPCTIALTPPTPPGTLAANVTAAMPTMPAAPAGNCTSMPSYTFKQLLINAYEPMVIDGIQTAYNDMVDNEDFTISADLLERGWGGAGIWYNHIAEWNGELAVATIQLPVPTMLPSAMQHVLDQKRANDKVIVPTTQFEPTLADGTAIDFTDEEYGDNVAGALNMAYRYWSVQGMNEETNMEPSNNIFITALNLIFGHGSLMEIRSNDDVHPLGQLSMLGKSIIESAIFNLMGAFLLSVGGGAASSFESLAGAGQALSSFSGMFVGLATIGLAIGFILYYILPFLPFIYFFFAVGGWVKSIFEAMVGVPLWALAHLRVDGDGIPGETASNGYFLIFEIFIRPILIVFGLIASVLIFSAMAKTLNGIFDMVTANVGGFDCATVTGGPVSSWSTPCDHASIMDAAQNRSVIDEFFYTIIYTIFIYMMATASFKLVDQIPNSILRWMGAGVQSFGDQRDDPAAGLVQYAGFGGFSMSSQMAGAMQSGGAAIGQTVGTGARGLGGLATGLTGRNAAANVGGAG